MRIDYSKYGDKVQFWKNSVENVKDFTGTSPPSIFIGRASYPSVFVGILSPPEQKESTSILDSPETWYKNRASIGDILGYRGQMVYSRFQSKSVKGQPGKMEEVVQEVSMAKKSADVEVNLRKNPKFGFNFDNWSSPVGSPAPVNMMKMTSNPTVEHKVDYITSDTDLRANKAVTELYRRGIEVSRLQKIFSAGMLGVPFQRKFVPTRWGITAVDDIISKSMINDVRQLPEIGEVTLYHNQYLGNHYEILFIPGQYQYELIEVWNAMGGKGGMAIDYEPNKGRKEYASNTHGAFYSGRLGIMEQMKNMKRQAAVIIVRDILPSYDVPMGIWQMRETVRGAFDQKPEKFATVTQALLKISTRVSVGSRWMNRSSLLKNLREQRNLLTFVSSSRR